MPVSALRKRERRKLFQPQRTRRPVETSNVRVVHGGNFQELSHRLFPGGSTHPRNDPSLRKWIYESNPLSPNFETFRGAQARHLPRGVWLWEKATLRELLDAKQRASKEAKSAQSELSKLQAQMKRRKMLVVPRLFKRRMALLEQRIQEANNQQKATQQEIQAINDWLKTAHREKLSELQKMKKPKLP